MRIESLGDRETRVLLALLHLHAKQGRVTVREVASGAGLALSVTSRLLDELRHEGLVSWRFGSQGTLRPTCRAVAFGEAA